MFCKRLNGKCQSNITRREFIETCSVGLLALSVRGVYANDRPESQKRNVLLIYLDDLRPELKCYDESKIISPNSPLPKHLSNISLLTLCLVALPCRALSIPCS